MKRLSISTYLLILFAGIINCSQVNESVGTIESGLPHWTIGPFIRPGNAQPIIRPNSDSRFDCPIHKESIAWESRHTFNPAAVVHDGRVCVLYRAEDDHGPGGIGGYTSRIGLATSDNGLSFTTEPIPVYYPAEDNQKSFEWTGGTEDPRIVTGPDRVYIMLYTQYQGKSGGQVRLGLASTRDLHTWTKHGCPFAGTQFESIRMKSAGILQQVENGQLAAAKVNGKYWMYFGEHSINIACSEDLIHWIPVDDGSGKPIDIMKVRPCKFDSQLTEVGPPPVLTPDGIVLIYNGKNGNPGKDGDPSLSEGVYTCGQSLFDKNDPTKLLARLDKPFFKPELDWEKSGQYAAGTTFAEGLVRFAGKWFLYYGCADTFVGVAVANY